MGKGHKGLRVAFDTLGCKLNQAETGLLARRFAQAGYHLVSPAEQFDIYVLNTCTVTSVADRKSRQRLRLARRRNQDAVVVAVGCYAERASEELRRIAGVDLVVGNDDKAHLLRLLAESGYAGSPEGVTHNSVNRRDHGWRTRAFVKIQDGCSGFCAYCIVPLVRRREESVPVEQVIGEVNNCVAAGYHEVVLTGVEIGQYHHSGVGLKGLLERILTETDVTRLRLSSLQPDEVSPELIQLWQDGRLCRHFHLSLQSGSDTVLDRMRRRYSVGDYQRVVSLIRSLVPEAAITTDVIVGFPGETDDEFEESYGFCRQTGFARIHVFPYSPRPGTLAARMPQPVAARVREARRQRLLALARESAQNFHRQFLGQTVPVLWEKQNGGVWSGLTDSYLRVFTTSRGDLTNRLLATRLVRTGGDGVWGELLE